MNGARAALLGLVLAVLVAVSEQGLVQLVDASGAKDQPALILILLLAAFLGVLTAVVTRVFDLPGATAPTALVIGWILIPPIMGAIPSSATHLFGGAASLTVTEGLALVTATVACAITLGVPSGR